MSVTQILDDADDAVRGIPDGATVLVGGFGLAGFPFALVDALVRQGASDLTVVNDNAGNGTTGLAALLASGPQLGRDGVLSTCHPAGSSCAKWLPYRANNGPQQGAKPSTHRDSLGADAGHRSPVIRFLACRSSRS